MKILFISLAECSEVSSTNCGHAPICNFYLRAILLMFDMFEELLARFVFTQRCHYNFLHLMSIIVNI